MKTRTNILFYLFLLTFAFVLGACNTTEPPDGNGDNKPDTTSHNFTWETFTFGGQSGSSYLLDVAIIDENNIWAVGIIYTADDTFNAVHWDGSGWELKKILYYGECSAVMYPPLKAIYAFSGEEIVLTNGGSIGRFDGNAVDLDCGVNPLLTGAINKIWGSSSSDFYVVGNNGNIAHYNGSSWMKIESGTELNVNDIYGAYNDKTQQYEILAVASNILESLDRDLLKIDGNTVNPLSTTPIEGTLRTIWFKPNEQYYVAGGGIYQKQILEEAEWKNEPLSITTYSTNRIRGNSINDIAATGGVGELLHYNGNSWYSYIEDTKLSSGNYYGLDFKDDLIIAVGQNNPQAVITVGRRTN